MDVVMVAEVLVVGGRGSGGVCGRLFGTFIKVATVDVSIKR